MNGRERREALARGVDAFLSCSLISEAFRFG
jgi:hypothetical protein